MNQVLAQAEKAFEKSPENGHAEKASDRRIEQLQARLANKNEVIADSALTAGRMGDHLYSFGVPVRTRHPLDQKQSMFRKAPNTPYLRLAS